VALFRRASPVAPTRRRDRTIARAPARSALLLLALVTASERGAAAAPLSTAPGAGSSASTLVLASQTSWVQGPSGMTLQLKVVSPLPSARLGIRIVLYSRLGNRGDFELSLTGQEPATELPIDAPQQTIPLAALTRGSRVVLHLPVTAGSAAGSTSTTSPPLGLDCSVGNCAGVYPLEVVLWDRLDNVQLASLTTHLVYAPPLRAGGAKLGVGLVLPLGAAPALKADGSSALTKADLTVIASVVRQLAANPRTSVSLDLYPQVLLGLERTPGYRAKSILNSLVSLLRSEAALGSLASRQLLAAPFADVDVESLVAAGLGGDLASQLSAGARTLASVVGKAPAAAPFISRGPIGPDALALLRRDGFQQLVVPPSSVSPPVAPVHTATSPFYLIATASGTGGTTGTATTATTLFGGGGTTSTSTTASGGATSSQSAVGSPVAFVGDPVLAGHFDATTADPVLAAHQFLAELATIYFDDPSLADRGVVVAPNTAGQDAPFLANVLSGLASSPILAPSTLGSLFSTIAPGANSSPEVETVPPPRGAARSLPKASIVAARQTLRTIASIVPDDRGLLGRVGDSILEAESAQLKQRTARRFAGAASRALGVIAGSLSISGTKTFTLTSATGRIPITVLSAASPRAPVHVLLQLRSAELTFPGPERGTYPLKLTAKDFQREVSVSARTSGESRIDVSLVAPVGGQVLVGDVFEVQSRAVSGLAIALSIGALLVLAAWWFRSYGRHRRRIARERAERAARERAEQPAAAAPSAPA